MVNKFKSILIAFTLMLICSGICAAANVTADFSADVYSGEEPLTVQFTDTSTGNVTSWSWDFDDGTSSNETNPTNIFSAGNYTVSLTVSDGNETNTTTDYISVTAAAALIYPEAAFSTNKTSGDAPLTVKFTDESKNATSWSWDFDDGNNSTNKNPVHTYDSAGDYTVTLEVSNANGTDTETKTISVSAPSNPDPVADFETNVTEGSVPLVVLFNDTSSDATSWSWDFGDGNTSTSQNVTHTFDSIGTYNVSLTATNSYGSDTANTTITVYSATYFWGNRIWDENGNMSSDYYIWDGRSFSGFYYDLDTGDTSESMNISNIGRNIDEGDIEYSTHPIDADFEFDDWGSYDVIGFMAQKYFAGYTDNSSIDDVDELSLMSEGILAKVLLDTDDGGTFNSGSSFPLEEGYAINVQEVDVDGDTVWISLTKDGDEVDEGFLSAGDTYVYDKDLDKVDDVPIIIVHFEEVFSGRTAAAVVVDGIFQISDDYEEIEDGDEFDEMEITNVNEDTIVMENSDDVNLDDGDIIELMGNLNIIVADDSDLRFAPYVDMSEPGTYELRGTIATEADSTFTWTPLNFEGFYYDIDEGLSSESLTFTYSGSRNLEDDDVTYTTKPVEVEFENDDWGKYQVIGFMADKYFAGYTEDTNIDDVDELSVMSEGQLSKVLIDDDDERSISMGSSLILEEGYAINIKEVDVDGDSVWLELTKDGDEVDDAFLSSNEDYVYDDDVGDVEDLPLIIVHFNNVFSGRESSAVFIEGIFQISDEYVEIEEGDDYDSMTIDDVNDDEIVMELEDDIDLDEDDTIELMGDIQIQVADDDTLRYYPFIEVETEASESLDLDIDPENVLEGDEVVFTVTSRGSAVSGVSILVEEEKVGETDSEGTFEYEFGDSGTHEITAEKSGYVSDTEKVEVISSEDESKKMTISVSPEEIYEGSSFTISVIKSISSDPVEDAEVRFDNILVGETDENGNITYIPEDSGTHTIKASLEGMIDSELNIKVQELAAYFVFSNLGFSSNPATVGSEVTVSLDAVNEGHAGGNYTVELYANNEVVDSEEISLGINESTTVELSFTPEAEGTYFIEAGGLSDSLEVEAGTSIIWYIAGALGLAIAGGAIYLFTRGGGDTAKLTEAVESLKESISGLKK
jgi:S-layer protein (TIGR01567 family)